MNPGIAISLALAAIAAAEAKRARKNAKRLRTTHPEGARNG